MSLGLGELGWKVSLGSAYDLAAWMKIISKLRRLNSYAPPMGRMQVN